MQHGSNDLARKRLEQDEAFRAFLVAIDEKKKAWRSYKYVREKLEPQIAQKISELDKIVRDEEKAYRALKGNRTKNKGKARSLYNETVRKREHIENALNALERKLLAKKDEHADAKRAFLQAKRRFNHERTAYIKLRSDLHRELARQASIPAQYHDNMVVKRQGSVVQFFFGGDGSPDGDHHGHYVLQTDGESKGNVPYARMPHEPHGPQNFVDRHFDPDESPANE